MKDTWICHVAEIARWLAVIVGFQVAFLLGRTPQEQFHLLFPWIVIPLAGLTGIESVFLGPLASKVTGYAPSAYQRQSGINNISLAIGAFIVFVFKWGIYAEASLMSVLLIFLVLSACNHAYSAIKEGNKQLKNMLRPVMTLALVGFVVPVMLKALSN